MIKVIVNGAKGKMGQETVKAVKNDPELELVGETDVGDDLGALIKKTKAAVVVDFTQPTSRVTNVKTILESGANAVIGTTGFTPEDLKVVDSLCQKTGQAALIAPNFTIGAVLMMQFAAQAAKYMPHVEIIEFHHDNKKDAPSGTAIKTAQLINEAVGQTKAPNVESEEMLKERSQGAKEGNIRIHAVRLPGYVASQEIIFGGPGQTLKIRHDSINRECYMPGVIMACKKVINYKKLIYGLENIL